MVVLLQAPIRTFATMSIFMLTLVGAKFPVIGVVCMNEGEPLVSESSEFTCKCKPGFDGSLCQYEVDTTHGQSKGFNQTVMNLSLCVFFLILLPTLLIYLIRTVYLSLKRCGSVLQQNQHRERNQSFGVVCGHGVTSPVRHSLGSGRYNHIPTSTTANCRPLHGTQSMTMRNTSSLSTEQFSEILFSLQQSLQLLRQTPLAMNDAEGNGQPLYPPPLPPPYESVVVRHTNSLHAF